MATRSAATTPPVPIPVAVDSADHHPAATPPPTDAAIAANNPSYRVGICGVSGTNKRSVRR